LAAVSDGRGHLYVNIEDKSEIGEIDAMVAIRCLDEGIDIPACRTDYLLASSRNPRQFI